MVHIFIANKQLVELSVDECTVKHQKRGNKLCLQIQIIPIKNFAEAKFC